MQSSTLEDYRRRVRRSLHFIEVHLDDEKVSLQQLAKVAHFSPYHFHRVFRGLVGESVASYVRRLKMDRAAFLLKNTSQPIVQVALGAGYESHEAFTRAFRQHFAKSPRQYRRDNKLSPTENRWQQKDPGLDLPRSLPSVSQRYIETIHVAFMRSVGPYTQLPSYFGRLLAWGQRQQIEQNAQSVLGIAYDDPVVTDPERLRFDVCLQVPRSCQGSPEIEVKTVAGQHYAVLEHVGPYSDMHRSYTALLGHWFPQSGYLPQDAGCLEFYMDDPHTTMASRLRALICVPLCP